MVEPDMSRNADALTADVLIAGGGPCGLMLANELGRRGVTAILVDQKPGTAFSPQANATQARSMEHYRRLGFADEIRAMGLPDDYPTDIAYFTRYAKYEITRFSLPASGAAGRLIKSMSGSWSAAELPHRVSQKFVEQVLRKHAAALPGISINYGWRLTEFRDDGEAIAARIANVETGEERDVAAKFLFGADGPRSFVRRKLGYELSGEASAERDFMGGRMHAIYLAAPEFYQACPHQKAWMYWAFNRDRRAFMAAVDGKGEFAFHTQLRDNEPDTAVTDAVALGMFEQAMGARINVRILARDTWLAGRALVAEKFASGRVLLGGDAVHLFTPTGGMGYNTAIEDAVNAGWKLAAVVHGQAPASLLQSYELERRPVALRNTGFARRFADSVGLYRASPALETATAAGEAARRRAGEYLNFHARSEFNIPGFTLGARYDGSPIIVDDGSPPPPDAPSTYVPTGKPGGRAPHVWLEDGRSLYDSFGFSWTLLRLGPAAADASAFQTAAAQLGIDLKLVDCDSEEAYDLFETDLALIRPDQIVAWRRHGHAADADPGDILGRAMGRADAPRP
jgi:2-polyprenyl-6-methoxyphenol hydroxylase-like FAD-dependent oxidoreductase